MVERLLYTQEVTGSSPVPPTRKGPGGINGEETEEQPNLDCHSLRHVFGSAMIKATNGDAERVRVWMGHSDTKTLLRCYSHEFEAVRGGRQIAQEIAQMDAAFAG